MNHDPNYDPNKENKREKRRSLHAQYTFGSNAARRTACALTTARQLQCNTGIAGPERDTTPLTR